MILRRFLVWTSTVVALTLGVLATATSTASADSVVRARTGMTVASFDRAVAEANGYAIVTLPSGTVASVPKALATTAAAGDPSVLATTLGESTVGGNCGYSYIEFYARGGATADLRTGFGVIRGAISYWWRVDIIDTGGVSQQRWSGSLANRTTWVSDNGN